MLVNTKTYSNAKYVAIEKKNISINVEINGLLSCVPIAEDNDDYNNIIGLVENGDLTIADAD